MSPDAKANPDVATTHAGYTEMSPYWELMDDVTKSQKYVQDLGTKYLPILDGMSDDHYEAYKLRASFPLFLNHTLSTFIGMVMRKKVLLNNIPPKLVDNIDGAGKSIITYVRDLTKEYLKKGRAATIVEYSDGIQRPKLLLYHAENIINWREDTVNDTTKITLLVLKELKEAVENVFKVQQDVEYRVLTLERYDSTDYVGAVPANDTDYFYRQRVFDAKGNVLRDVIPMSKHKPLSFIPAEIHGGAAPQYPPLITIAEQNLSWYRLDAGYKHGLHYVGLPTPWLSGTDPDAKHAPKAIGPSEIWFLDDDAKAGMLEFTGEGLGAFVKAKEECFDAIVTLSSRILAPPAAQNETATAANIRNAGETASLAEMIGELSNELTRALNYAANWTDTVQDELSVKINTDFIPVILSGSDVASYVASYLKGGMSFYTLFQTLKRGEIQEGSRKIEDEIKDIVDEQLEIQAREVVLADELAAISAQYQKSSVPDPRNNNPKDKRPLGQSKDGEQVDKGQSFKEN